MKNTYYIIRQLQEASGTNAKIDILKNNLSDIELESYLSATYEPSYNYYMSDVPDGIEIGNYWIQWTEFENILSELRNRKVTGHAARDFVIEQLNGKNEESIQLFRWLLAHDIRAGVGIKTLRKLYPDVISYSPYMRCDLLSNVKLDDWDFANRNVYSQEKYDGMFCNFIFNQHDYAVTTRSGMKFPKEQFKGIYDSLMGANLFQFEFKEPCYVLHGELLIETSDGKLLPRKESNGMFNSVLQTGELIPKGYNIRYVVWDCISNDTFKGLEPCYATYEARYEFLQSFLCDSVEIAPIVRVQSLSEALDHYKLMLQQGKEGTVMKRADMLWKDETSRGQIKFKMEVVGEFRIVGYKEGKGKYKGKVGAILAESEDGKIETSAGAMIDAIRDEITVKQDYYLNKIVSIKFNSLIYPIGKDPMYHLSHPRFDDIRLDKSTANTLDDIIDIIDQTIENM